MTHWLTIFDNDGEPEGVVCRCTIDRDHLASGAPFPDGEAE